MNFSKELAAKALLEYNIGDINSISFLSEGFESSNFLVETSNGKFLLRKLFISSVEMTGA